MTMISVMPRSTIATWPVLSAERLVRLLTAAFS